MILSDIYQIPCTWTEQKKRPPTQQATLSLTFRFAYYSENWEPISLPL